MNLIMNGVITGKECERSSLFKGKVINLLYLLHNKTLTKSLICMLGQLGKRNFKKFTFCFRIFSARIFSFEIRLLLPPAEYHTELS
jgi:hypothetical protein